MRFSRGHLLHLTIFTVSLGFYFWNRIDRPLPGISALRDALPSFLFPLACFSLVALLPTSWGGNNGSPLTPRITLIGTGLAIAIFEGIGPHFGYGTYDFKDVIALALGLCAYRLSSHLANQ